MRENSKDRKNEAYMSFHGKERKVGVQDFKQEVRQFTRR